MEGFPLTNGVVVPAVGMGTGSMNLRYRNPVYLGKRVAREAVRRVRGEYDKESNYTVAYELRKLSRFRASIATSRKLGYSLYDTAYNYGNCAMMGAELWRAGSREDAFLISKCSNRAQRQGTVREEFERTLADLRTDYVDLYLIHWPQTGTFVDAWKVLEDLYRLGRARAIGVSNFHAHHIDELLSSCEIAPMVDEVECHPLLQQRELREYLRRKGIRLIAHTSTGKMRSGIKQSILGDVALVHGKSIAQVALRWHYQLGDVCICNSLDARHMRDNLDIFDFELSDVEMDAIATMDSGARIWPDPDNCDFMKL